MKLNIQIEGATAEQLKALAAAMCGGVETPAPKLSGAEAHYAIVDEAHPAPAAPEAPAEAPATAEDTAEPTNASGIELDATGVPWDARIHSSNKQKTAKGHWNKRRNVDAAKFAEIHAQLLADQSAPAAPAQDPVTPDSIVAAVSDTPPPPPTTAPAASTPPPPPAAAPAQQEPADDAPKTFVELVQLLTVRGDDQGRIQTVAEEIGLSNISGLANRPDLVATFWDKIK